MHKDISGEMIPLTEEFFRPYVSERSETQEPGDEDWQADIVARDLKGDERAFALIADHYGGLLLRTAYLIVHDEDTAKDILQETLILAWRNLQSVREPRYLRAWLLKITVNQSISFKRQFSRRTALLREQILQYAIDATIHQADTQRGHTEESLDLAQAIQKLPLNQRVVLILFYYHKMTMPEISGMLGVAENTLRKRQQAALEKIRRLIQTEFVSQENSTLSENFHSRMGIRREGL